MGVRNRVLESSSEAREKGTLRLGTFNFVCVVFEVREGWEIEAGFIALVGVEGGPLLGSDRHLITDIATLFEFQDEGKKCQHHSPSPTVRE